MCAPGRRAYMTIDEVLDVARAGAEQGCTEVLLTLGAWCCYLRVYDHFINLRWFLTSCVSDLKHHALLLQRKLMLAVWCV